MDKIQTYKNKMKFIMTYCEWFGNGLEWNSSGCF